MSKENFNDIEVSTKTVIALTNIQINLDNLFHYLPITPYTPIEKKRGRKKKSVVEVKPEILPEGSIISIQKGAESRGYVVLKKQRSDAITFFLHSATLVISLEQNKFINVKVSANGNFQITGCKYDEHYIKVMKYIYQHIKNSEIISGEKIINFQKENEDKFKILFNTVMQNMDYNIGFNISREKLNDFINNNTDFKSIYEGSISTGVNIKLESKDPYDKYLKYLIYHFNPKTSEHKEQVKNVLNKEILEIDQKEFDRNWEDSDKEDLNKFFSFIDTDEYKKRRNKKEKYHTFLVFASGSIIMSSRGSFMKDIFKSLVNLLINNKNYIEEKVEV